MDKCSHSEWEEWMDYCTRCGEDSLRVIVAEKRIAELEAFCEKAEYELDWHSDELRKLEAENQRLRSALAQLEYDEEDLPGLLG